MLRQGFFVIACLAVVASAQDASAQVGPEWTDRGYFNVNVGFESTSGTLNDAATFNIYGENGTTNVQQSTDSGAFFDLSAGARVWRNVSVGLGFHRDATNGNAALQAAVPNPVRFNDPRPVSLNVADLGRAEQAIHLQIGYMVLVGDRLSVHVTAGPSIFRLRQDVVSTLNFPAPSAPFDNVDATAVVQQRSDSAAGVNAGIDVGYEVFDSDAYRIGAGVFVRYSGATGRVQLLQNTVETDLGGVQFGLGGRVRF